MKNPVHLIFVVAMFCVGVLLTIKLMLVNDIHSTFGQDPLNEWIGIAVVFLLWAEFGRQVDKL